MTLRLRAAGSLAALVGHAAGWTVRSVTPVTSDESEVEFDRYIGVDHPDGELQSAHHAQLEQALTESGLSFERVSHGVTGSGHMNPIAASALLVRAATEQGRSDALAGADRIEEADFVGTCFAFRHSNVFVSAAHCALEAATEMLFVNTPGLKMQEVIALHIHPSADLALLKLGDSIWPGGVEPFVDLAEAPKLGDEFMAHGFPEDAPEPDATEVVPTLRLFRGSFQRVFEYRRGAFGYAAAELSIPSPAGLSGGALFSPRDFNNAIAVATENVQSFTYVGRFEESTAEGVMERQIERDIVQYGIAALLAPVKDWLDDLSPRFARMP